MHPSVKQLWDRYRSVDPDAPATVPIAYCFCDNPKDAQELLDLVLAGRKRATASSLAELRMAGDPVPRPGDFAIVTDWNGEAKAVIRTHAVDLRKFHEVDAAFAHAEGEGDRSLAWWRDAHREYYRRVLAESGCQVDDDLEIVCEYFDLVFAA